jgi:acetyltransferase-like isoleucine patch superfamily enzyme
MFLKLRRAVRRGIDLAKQLRPLSMTALRTPPTMQPPPPEAFASFGRNSVLIPPTTVEGAQRIYIGDHVRIGEISALMAMPGSTIDIGDRASLGRGLSIVSAARVSIAHDVVISSSVAIVDCWRHPPTMMRAGDAIDAPPAPPAEPVTIETGAYLGIASVVGPGVVVGAGARVGEGAVVLDDVPPGAVVLGNPARVVGTTGSRA